MYLLGDEDILTRLPTRILGNALGARLASPIYAISHSLVKGELQLGQVIPNKGRHIRGIGYQPAIYA